MKRYLAIAAIALLALTGCGNVGPGEPDLPSESPSVAQEPAPAQTDGPPGIADLVGEWKQSNPNSPTSYQTATITADTISVNWVNEEQSSTSVYWVGTFEAPNEFGDWQWTSTRDAAATDNALLASTDDTKVFNYAGGVISYDVTAMGTTMTVDLTKQ